MDTEETGRGLNSFVCISLWHVEPVMEATTKRDGNGQAEK